MSNQVKSGAFYVFKNTTLGWLSVVGGNGVNPVEGGVLIESPEKADELIEALNQAKCEIWPEPAHSRFTLMDALYDSGVTNDEYSRYYAERKLHDADSPKTTPHSYSSAIVSFIDTEKQRLATLWLDHPEGPGRDAIGRRFTRASKLLDQAIRGYVPS